MQCHCPWSGVVKEEDIVWVGEGGYEPGGREAEGS